MVNKSNILKIESQTTGGIIRMVAIGVVGIIGVALLVKLIRNVKQNSSSNRLVDDDNVRIATELNSAIHPGRNWVSNIFMGADRDRIFSIAQNLKNFDDVSKEYQNLYRESLTLELQDALGDEYPSFVQKLKNVKSGTDSMAQADIVNLSTRLRNEIAGLNWTTRDLTPFSELIRLTDVDFKRVVSAYNSKYSPDKLNTDLQNESGLSGLLGGIQKDAFDEIKKKILTRYESLY